MKIKTSNSNRDLAQITDQPVEVLPAPQGPSGLESGQRTDGAGEHKSSALAFLLLLIPFVILAIAIIMSTRQQLPVFTPPVAVLGSADRGRQTIGNYGCGACHTIQDVPGAIGKVGPKLDSSLRQRTFIAGRLNNTQANLTTWIQQPQEVSPGVDMPDLGISQQDAQDIAAFLYSLK